MGLLHCFCADHPRGLCGRVKEARNDVKNEVHLRLETKKVLGAAKEENKELLSKLIAKDRERRSAEAGLKNAQTQAEDQRKLLY